MKRNPGRMSINRSLGSLSQPSLWRPSLWRPSLWRPSLRGPSRRRRRGWISTIELLFVLPVILSVGLVSVQLILIHTAYQRVQSAAIEGACVAAAGGDMDEIEDAVGLSLGYLAGAGFELTREYVTAVTSPTGIPIGDRVAIGVRIPMGNVTTNYLGLLGGSVNDLHVRSVAIKTLTVVIPGPAYNGS